ncbi:sigma-54-dependent Fis family transcriptional regulator [Paraburkholderia dipogonis]|uniref:Sigma-54-dependent Fis family transcriptional regulator n=2 Tax=Paraburkholderia dipogonis TaxID=1211383 RepID=A0A4Y8MHU0_9BURK|nr:sigma-54-dependent Fis family transcriptional regulator [Paraburkholderia dipogonis]
MSPRAPVIPYHPESIWRARRAFFDEGCARPEQIGDALIRSWMRCGTFGRNVHENVEFTPVHHIEVTRLLERHRVLVNAAQPELASLARSVSDAGYAVLLTDAHGASLVVDGAIDSHGAQLRHAFRVGVDLSEQAVGTSAMSVAMSEGRPTSICGAEHYFAKTHVLHCCAAPIFDPQGDVIGAVDVSHDMPDMLQSALWLAERCAHRIERRLFLRLPARLRLEIDVDAGEATEGASTTQAWLALGQDGELLAASRSAQRLLGLPQQFARLDFEALFGERFDGWRGRWHGATSGAPLVMHNGIRLRATAMSGTPAVTPPAWRSSATFSDSLPIRSAPCFGDARIEIDFARAQRAFHAELPVLITGETGCGKEVAARALHTSGPRAEGPLVTLNCAAIPSELLAAELFGHVEGAYTGARRGGAEGKVEAANGGTLFLDEIGDTPLHLQAALLRVLDAREVMRLGENKARPVDLCLVCATHQDLHLAVEHGRFREDLLYRIAGYQLHLLPLRERSDFDAILDTLLAQAGETPSRVSSELRLLLRSAQWPGNVRQLAHALRRALALAGPDVKLTAGDFEIDRGRSSPQCAPPSAHDLMRKAQFRAISDALQVCGGNVSEAARLLGIGRATLYRKLAERRAEPPA